MPGLKITVVAIAVIILLLEGLTGGLFLSMIIPDWQGMLGHTFCVVGGFIVQPVWDFGGLMIPIPVTDDFAAGLLIASVISWLFIRRMSWSFKRKIIALGISFGLGVVIYKIIGLLLLYWAEVYYNMAGCIGEFAVGPLTIQWAWFNPLFWVMIIFSMFALVGAVLALRKRAGGGDG